jgi:hypothetical protein
MMAKGIIDVAEYLWAQVKPILDNDPVITKYVQDRLQEQVGLNNPFSEEGQMYTDLSETCLKMSILAQALAQNL